MSESKAQRINHQNIRKKPSKAVEEELSDKHVGRVGGGEDEREQGQAHKVAPSVHLVQLGQWQKVWQVESSCPLLDLLCSTQPTIIKQIAGEKQQLFRYQIIPCRTGQTRYARKEKVKKENREGAKEKRKDEGKEDGGEAQRGTWRLTDLAVVSPNKSVWIEKEEEYQDEIEAGGPENWAQ